MTNMIAFVLLAFTFHLAMSVEKIKAIHSVIQFCCSEKHPTFILEDFNLLGID